MQRTAGTIPEATITGIEIVSGLIIMLMTIITIEIAEITRHIIRIFLVFDTIVSLAIF